MINFLKRKKHTFVTLRAEDLKIGDRFVYDNVAVEVWTIIPDGNDEVSVTLGYVHPGNPRKCRIVVLRRELFITVTR